MAGPSKQQLEFQHKSHRLRVIQKFGFYATLVLVAWLITHCVYLCVRELAGRATTASFFLTLYMWLKAPRALALALAYLLTGSTAVWGAGERRAKKKAIARLHPMARKAQAMIDSKKGSSNITLSGDTGPDDL